MLLELEPYRDQAERWPKEGRAILAQYDEDTIVVYQAYRPLIGRFAAEKQYFGAGFKLGRMTWIKPNFLWMMYRSSWSTAEGQEVVLAIRLRRRVFDEVLKLAVHSSFRSEVYATEEEWKERLTTSDVRLQWDPDHAPSGAKVERRAIQLGLRGEVCRKFAKDWIVEIQDISNLVAEQRELAAAGNLDLLQTPREDVYPVEPELAAHLELHHGIVGKPG